jgi:hypothetical protein
MSRAMILGWHSKISCNINYAAIVMIILPLLYFSSLFRSSVEVFHCHNLKDEFAILLINICINKIVYAIFVITKYHFGNYNDQTKNFTRQRDIQYQLTQSARSSIQNTRFFRPFRFIASQIRNAKTCSSRRMFNYTGYQDVWFFTTSILSSPGVFQSKRVIWIDASQARTQTCLQAFSRSDCFYKKTSHDQSKNYYGSYSTGYQETFWYQRTQTQYRTRLIQISKKNPVVSFKNIAKESQERYETLRVEVLSQQNYTELASFIQCGLVEWLQTLPDCAYNSSQPSLEQPVILNHPNSELVQVLATIIIHQQEKQYGYV